MTVMPQLNVVCGRCGKRREGVLRHVCYGNSKRKAKPKLKLSLGKCETCGKPRGNPLTHTCKAKSDFKKRKTTAAKAEKAAGRRKRQGEKHDYQACSDQGCPRPLCVAFKTGWKTGYDQGYTAGYAVGYTAGYAQGFPDGIAACPRAHR